MANLHSLIVYENGHEEWEDQASSVLPHLASTLVDLGVFDGAALEQALKKVFLVCIQVHVPIDRHVRQIHVHSAAGHIANDWALSDFAFFLLLLNGDVAQPASAFAQAYAIFKAFEQRG